MLDPRLVHVVAVAKAGTFTAAAQNVGVTQSAITKSIAALEAQIGHPLFNRTSRGAMLTAEGKDFVERASRLLEDAWDLLDGYKARTDPFAGTLRVGICPASLEWRLVEPLAALLAKHRSIRIEMSSSSFERMLQQLRNGGVDVCIGYDAAFSECPDLKRQQIPSMAARVFVRRGHPLLERAAITAVDLAEFEFVSPSDSRPYGDIIHGIYKSQGVEWQKRLHIVDYFPAAQRIVATSDALGVVAHLWAKGSSVFQRNFQILEDLDLFPPSPLCCTYQARRDLSPASRALIAFMRGNH